MTSPGISARMVKSVRAAVAGWLAAAAATSPMQVISMHGNLGHDPRLFAETVAMGLPIWFLWTFGIAAIAWLLGCVPLAALASADFLHRHRRLVLILAAGAGWNAVLVKFKIRSLFGPEPYMNFWVFWLYFSVLHSLRARNSASLFAPDWEIARPNR